jgi:hypothetical protein
MEDHLKSMAIWAGVGAALGLGVAMGLGFRVLATGALIGVGAGVALGVGSSVAERKRHAAPDGMLSAAEHPALH